MSQRTNSQRHSYEIKPVTKTNSSKVERKTYELGEKERLTILANLFIDAAIKAEIGGALKMVS